MQPMQPMMGVPGMVPMVAPSMVQMPGVGMGTPLQPPFQQPTFQFPGGNELPRLSYTAERGWGGWDLASRHYSGTRLERSWLEKLMSRVSEFMDERQLCEEAAHDSFIRVYHHGEGPDAGNRSLGGAAAYQAFLLWRRDHQAIFSQNSHDSNVILIISMAVAELHRLWDIVDPRSSRANLKKASEHAAATVQYLYERHFKQPGYGQAQPAAAHTPHHHIPPHSPVERRRRRKLSSASSSSDRSRHSRRHSRRYDDSAIPPPVMQPGVPMQPGMVPAGATLQSGMASQYGYPQQPYAAGYSAYAPGYPGQQAYVPQAGAAGYYPTTAGQVYYPSVVDPNTQYPDPSQYTQGLYAQGQYPQGYYPQTQPPYGYLQQGYRYY
ncbi:hypothetical protein CcaverHIS002_0101880 [Cutaneotrichosporon cavernicola]|nr:hypothetical protein CcaverHIS002_0101880 [Cutaneotrichosporon cavernicola]